ncbi:MAG: tetratricopeptide repeat protein [Luteolibacter sp.]
MKKVFDYLAAIARSLLGPGRVALKSYERGVECAGQARWEDSAVHFQCAVSKAPGVAAWHCAHGNALLKLKRWNEALDAFKLALKGGNSLTTEQRVSAEAGSGLCLMSLNKWRAAEAALARAMASGCRNARIQFQYGTCLFKLGRFSEAVEILEKSARKKPGNRRCAAALSAARQRMNPAVAGRAGADSSDIPDCDKDSQEYQNARFYAKRAARLEKARDFSAAVETYRLAIAIYPREIRWHVALADALSRSEPAALIRPALADTHSIRYSGRAHVILYVIFSPLKGRHIFKGFDFKGDTLLLAEERLTYYTYNLAALLDHLKSTIANNGYQKVCMLGSSKGSYGALWASAWCARELPQVDFLVVAFSPQTGLWPLNRNIFDLPSYQTLRKMASGSTTTGEDLQAYGSLEWLEKLSLPNIEGRVIYGANLPRDAFEAERLKDVAHLEMMPVPDFPFHGTAALFTKQGDSLRRVLIGAEARTADDAYFNREDSETLVDQFLGTFDPTSYTVDALLEPWRRKPGRVIQEGT